MSIRTNALRTAAAPQAQAAVVRLDMGWSDMAAMSVEDASALFAILSRAVPVSHWYGKDGDKRSHRLSDRPIDCKISLLQGAVVSLEEQAEVKAAEEAE